MNPLFAQYAKTTPIPMMICAHAYPRAGLIGNPSNGNFGRPILFAFSHLLAEVTLYESPRLQIRPAERDISGFASLSDLIEDVRRHRDSGGLRLPKAAIKTFYDHITASGQH